MPRPKTRQNPVPTIKGVFVNSHINRLREERGEDAVRELERRVGSCVVFKNLEDVPVQYEVRILEHILDIVGHTLHGTNRQLEAGRLHFRNFSHTTLGAMLLSSLPHTPKSLKTLLCNSGSIGRSVFKHTNLTCTEGRRSVVVVMQNSTYPPEHFAGFFDEWARTYGLGPNAVHTTAAGTTHTYTITGF